MTQLSSVTQWSNWTGDQICTPARLERPSTVEEVAAAVRRAAKDDLKVRVVGAGHSFTPAVLTDGVMISLERMDRVLAVDADARTVRTQAGISLSALNGVLDRHGLALENMGDVDVQSIAGATATGTHGTGATLKNLSANILALELVTADGSVVEVSEASDPDAWRAARVSIGALGIVTAVTLRVVPAFTLRGVDRPMSLSSVLDDLDRLIDGHEHFEFYMFPDSDRCQTRINDRTDEAPRPRGRARSWAEDIFLVNHVFGATRRVGRRFPSSIPAMNRLAARAWGPSTRVDRSHRIFTSPRLVRFTEMEYAIPREHAPEAIIAVKEIADRRDFQVSFPIEVRFVAGDDAFLSPASARATCYIAVHMFRGMTWEPYFRAVESVMDTYKGRPHWGKRHLQTAATLAPRYPAWDRFLAVRERFDPGRRFTNDYVSSVLDGPAAP